MNKKLKIGLVGLGARGYGILRSQLLSMTDRIDIVGVCDLYDDRNDRAIELIFEKAGYRPNKTTDYKELLDMDIDAVIILCAWEDHINVACSAMEKGIYVGIEVGGAYSVEECWRLVRTYEKTKIPCMMLENACYGKREMMLYHMERLGLFGEVVHCAGSYSHDLRSQIAHGIENRHYRLRNYINRCCDNYPTHELVPIGKVLKINNGNRIVSLCSMASCAKGLHEYIVKEFGADHEYGKIEFKQGDVVSTTIKCANGQTISITLDTTLPRGYSRSITVRGTKGSYFEDTDSFFFDDEHKEYEGRERRRELWGNADKYEEKYLHPLWQSYDGAGSHGGMDYLVISAFIECALENREPPIDVYDTATYMAITALTEKSIVLGGAPVAMPDFTNGRWYRRNKENESKYDLW